jgi:hypothetical protein
VLIERLFGIFLHAGIDCGMDPESVTVKIIGGAVGLEIFVDPPEKRIIRPFG